MFQLEAGRFLPSDLQYPIKTLRGRSSGNDASTASLVVTPESISAQIFLDGRASYVNSKQIDATMHRLEVSPGGGRASSGYQCLTPPTEVKMAAALQNTLRQESVGHSLRTFRLAAGATAEFTEYFGSKEEATRQVVTALSRADEIFYRELGISFQLVQGFERLVFTDKSSDPFSSNDPSEDLLKECQAAFDSMIGTENYDVGIVLTRGKFGLAYIRSVCNPLRKGSSCVGLPNPEGDAFHVNLVTHELAHQFGANHTFNSPSGFCLERRNEWAAFEPGAGSTIMSYSSFPCDDDSFQADHDAYFHAKSLSEIREFIYSPGGLVCAAITPDNNLPPSASPTRIFPALERVLAGSDSPEEQLPQISRYLGFRVVARDAHDHGAITWADTQLQVTNIAGPFRIRSHGAMQTLQGSTRLEWSTGGTEGAPIFAREVRITLSTNGGMSFPIVLAASTANDGEEVVVLPAVNTLNARLKVEPTNNIFFDINDAPLTIASADNDALKLDLARAAGGKVLVSWASVVGTQYRLERADSLPPPEWSPLLTTNAPGSSVSVTLSPSTKAGYYRLIQQ